MRLPSPTKLLAPLLFSSALCAGQSYAADYYFHDADLSKRMQDVKDRFRKIAEKKSAADPMLTNLDAAAQKERATLERVAETRMSAELSALGSLDWERLRNCAQGSKCLRAPGDSCVGRTQGAPLPAREADTTPARATAIAARIKILSGEIEKLAELAASDPDGQVLLADVRLPAQRQPFRELLQALDKAEGELGKNQAIQGIHSLFGRLNDLVANAEKAVDLVTEEQSEEHKKLASLLDVLRKAKDRDLIKDDPLRQAVTRIDTAALPDDFRAALKQYTGNELKTVGDLTTFLATEDASIAQVRLELRKDLRRSVAELRGVQLEDMKSEIEILRKQLRVANLQLERETQLRTIASQGDAALFSGCVYGGLVNLVDQHQHLPGQLARQKTPSGDISVQIQRNRRAMFDYVSYVSIYFDRVGFLEDERVMLAHEQFVREHRASILRSQAASLARERLVRNGLDGLAAFAEGGVSYDDVAGILRAIQTALLAIIAHKVN